jgi:predicted nucleic acid-binding protein
MILCDTNIFISAFNNKQETIEQLEIIGLENIVLSAVTLMELYCGMGNKTELAQMKKKLKYYDIIHIDKDISKKSIELIESFKLSHHLQIPDAIIGASSIVYQIPLYTYNLKDFNFMPQIKIYHLS